MVVSNAKNIVQRAGLLHGGGVLRTDLTILIQEIGAM
jgi:hypothetical protein